MFQLFEIAYNRRLLIFKMFVREVESFDENWEHDSCHSIPVLLFNNAKFYLLNSG